MRRLLRLSLVPVLLAAAAPPAAGLTIELKAVKSGDTIPGTSVTSGAKPGGTSGGGSLAAILAVAVSQWKVAIQDDFTLTVDYGWGKIDDDDIDVKAPRSYPGSTIVMDGTHIKKIGTGKQPLMFESYAMGERRLISTVDCLAVAQVSAFGTTTCATIPEPGTGTLLALGPALRTRYRRQPRAGATCCPRRRLPTTRLDSGGHAFARPSRCATRES